MNIDVEKISFLSVENYKEHLENVLNIFSNRFVFFKKTRSFFENVLVVQDLQQLVVFKVLLVKLME